MAIVGTTKTAEIETKRLLSPVAAKQNRLTGWLINKDANVDLYHEGKIVSTIIVIVEDNRGYFMMSRDGEKYTSFKECYKDSMIENGVPVYYKKEI